MALKSNPKQELNNEIIILRKSIKQAFNRTKLELVFKINKIKKKSGGETKLLSRKESELECYKTLKYSDVPLHWAVNKTKLNSILTNPTSPESDRVYARVLLNKKIQTTIGNLISKNTSPEYVEKIIKENDANIKKNRSEKKNEKSSDTEKVQKKSKEQKKSKVKTTVEDTPIKKPDAIVKKKKAARPDPPAVTMSVDSFFISASGDNYIANVAEPAAEEEHDHVKYHDRAPRKRTFNAPVNVTKSRLPVNSIKSKEPGNFSRPKEAQNPESTVRGKPITNVTQATDDIHPSWKAKSQMKKVQIQEFKGTKIKFD